MELYLYALYLKMGHRYVKLENEIILKIGNPYNYHAVINTDTGKKILAYKAIKEDLQEVLKAIVELRTNKSLNQILKESLTYYHDYLRKVLFRCKC